MGRRAPRSLPLGIDGAVPAARQRLRRRAGGRPPLFPQGLSRRGHVCRLRCRAPVRPEPRRARDARRRRLERLARAGTRSRRRRRKGADAGARARVGPRARRSISAALPEPAGGGQAGQQDAAQDRRRDRLRPVRRAPRRRRAARRTVQRERRQGTRVGERHVDPAVEHRHGVHQRSAARPERARGGESARGVDPSAATVRSPRCSSI